jgi:hypothetical protein
MLPIVAIPEVVTHYTAHFKEVFSESELPHFQKYITGLMVSENKTIQAMNNLFVLNPINQSTLNRFLTSSKYEVRKVQEKCLDLLNSQEATSFKANGAFGGVLSVDDTFLQHCGKHFDEIAKLHDHASNSYVLAHNLVNLHYSDDKTDYPVNFELWKPVDIEILEQSLRAAGITIKPKQEAYKIDAPKKWRQYLLYLRRKHIAKPGVREAYRTKIIIAEDLLQDFYKRYPDKNIPSCFDSWFTSPKFCNFIDKDLKQAYVGGIKTDEVIKLSHEKKMTLEAFAKELKQKHFSDNSSKPIFGKVTINYKEQKVVYYNYSQVHHIIGYGRVKLLISHAEEDLSDTARIFISNQRHWQVHQITRVGRHRWPIEEYHKEGKAEGLDKYQVRDFTAIEKHISMVFTVYSLLKHAQYDDVLLQNLQQQLNIEVKGSLANWRRIIQAQGLWLLLQWIDISIKQGSSLEKIMQILQPAFGLSS